jgi:hypothetical protein
MDGASVYLLQLLQDNFKLILIDLRVGQFGHISFDRPRRLIGII